MAVAAVILAAGQGTRMRSRLPKVLHQAAGRPLLEHVLRALIPLEPDPTVVVVGHGSEQVRRRFADSHLVFVEQSQQLGTGHALLCAREAVGETFDALLVLTGDAPLLTSESLAELLAEHRRGGPGMTLLTYQVADPTGLGRIVRDAGGNVTAIVEERDASEAERAITEVNPGFFAFDRQVFAFAEQLGNDNAQGEYYITDLPRLYLQAGLPVRTVLGRDETSELVGVNTREQLAVAERLLRRRIRRRWLAAGVTMLSPETTFIDDTVELAPDVVLEPGVILRGATRVGEGARIGAYAVLDDATVAPGAEVAPLTHLRGRSATSPPAAAAAGPVVE